MGEALHNVFICVAGHHDVRFKYLTILFVNYTSIKLKLIILKKEGNHNHSGPLSSMFLTVCVVVIFN